MSTAWKFPVPSWPLPALKALCPRSRWTFPHPIANLLGCSVKLGLQACHLIGPAASFICYSVGLPQGARLTFFFYSLNNTPWRSTYRKLSNIVISTLLWIYSAFAGFSFVEKGEPCHQWPWGYYGWGLEIHLASSLHCMGATEISKPAIFSCASSEHLPCFTPDLPVKEGPKSLIWNPAAGEEFTTVAVLQHPDWSSFLWLK